MVKTGKESADQSPRVSDLDEGEMEVDPSRSLVQHSLSLSSTHHVNPEPQIPAGTIKT